MSKIKLNDKEYDLASATEAAKAQLFHLQAIEAELARMNTLIAVLQTARGNYARALQQELETPGSVQIPGPKQ
jgi:Family of unknown function (DUF6447)